MPSWSTWVRACRSGRFAQAGCLAHRRQGDDVWIAASMGEVVLGAGSEQVLDLGRVEGDECRRDATEAARRSKPVAIPVAWAKAALHQPPRMSPRAPVKIREVVWPRTASIQGSWIAELVGDRDRLCSPTEGDVGATGQRPFRGGLAEEADRQDPLIARRFGRPGEDRSCREHGRRARAPGCPAMGPGRPSSRAGRGPSGLPFRSASSAHSRAAPRFSISPSSRSSQSTIDGPRSSQGGRIRHPREERQMAAREIAGFAAPNQLLPRVLADRLEHPVARRRRAALDDDQRAVDEASEPVDRVHRSVRHIRVAGDASGGRHGPAAHEDGQPA